MRKRGQTTLIRLRAARSSSRRGDRVDLIVHRVDGGLELAPPAGAWRGEVPRSAAHEPAVGGHERLRHDRGIAGRALELLLLGGDRTLRSPGSPTAAAPSCCSAPRRRAAAARAGSRTRRRPDGGWRGGGGGVTAAASRVSRRTQPAHDDDDLHRRRSPAPPPAARTADRIEPPEQAVGPGRARAASRTTATASARSARPSRS